MRNRRTSVTFPVFSGYKVSVIHARNIENTGRRLRVDMAGCAAAYVSDPDVKGGVIVLGPDADEATVAHEASHAIRAMLAWAGARNDNETFAYHLDFLVGRIHKFLRKGQTP